MAAGFVEGGLNPPAPDQPAQDVRRARAQGGAQEGLRFLFAARVAHQHPADRHAHAGVMPERRAGGDVEALLGAAMPAVEADPMPARGRVLQPLFQAWLPSTFDPWPPTRAGHAGWGWRVEAGIKAQPGDQGDYPEFRVWAGMMGGKEFPHATTQRAAYT